MGQTTGNNPSKHGKTSTTTTRFAYCARTKSCLRVTTIMGKYVHHHHTNLLAVGFFDIFTAAVAFIVSAGTVVVLVVAVAIANVLWNRAFGFAAFDSVLGILALALFAVSCLDLSALDRFRTAVASIEFAATVVVLVVAVAVALVLLETAFSFTVVIWLVVRVLAFAL